MLTRRVLAGLLLWVLLVATPMWCRAQLGATPPELSPPTPNGPVLSTAPVSAASTASPAAPAKVVPSASPTPSAPALPASPSPSAAASPVARPRPAAARPAVPALIPMPRRAPFTVIDQGTAARPGWDSRPLIITGPAAFKRFWSGTHPRPQTTCSPEVGMLPLPRLDFRKQVVVVFWGVPGSGEIDLLSLMVQGSALEAVYSNPLDPDAAGAPDRIPFEAVAVAVPSRPVEAVASRISAEMNWLYGRIPTLYHTAGGTPRDLTRRGMDRARAALRREGRALLTQIWRLQAESSDGMQLAYTWLLEAHVWDVAMNDNERARTRYSEVVAHFPGSGAARIARFHVSQLVRRATEARCMRRLNEIRMRMRADGDVGRGFGHRWLALGTEYEYLTTPRPDSLFGAVRCYEQGARDASEPEIAQNCLLRAADICRTYLNRRRAAALYAECVERYPDAPSVPTALRRMQGLYRDLGDPRSSWVYADFLRRHPRSAQAAAVWRMR